MFLELTKRIFPADKKITFDLIENYVKWGFP